MSDMLDEKSMMAKQRGETLKVISILSWVSMGFGALGVLLAIVSGPMTFEEMQETKVGVLQFIPNADVPEVKPIIEEVFMQLDIQNELHYTLISIQLASLILGFYGVMQMYNLKKRGYYYYLVYSILPVIVQFAFFGAGLISTVSAIYALGVSALFCILYGVQLKRMD